MKLSDLSSEQKLELKQNLLEKKNEAKGEGTSYGELADADQLVTDAELEAEYGNTEFTDDDFCCTAVCCTAGK